MAQGGSNVDALMPFLPQADDRHLHLALDGRNVRQTLTADGSGTTLLGRKGHLSHGLGMAHRLADVCLAAHDELALQLLDKGMDHGSASVSEQSMLTIRF